MSEKDYHKKLDDIWQKLTLEKIKKEKSVEILVYDKFWFSINQNDLPGVRIRLNSNEKVDQRIIPLAKGWEFKIENNIIEMYIKNSIHKDFFFTVINLIIAKIYFKELKGTKSIQLFLLELYSGKDFFEEENVPKKLTIEKQIGLFGEIQTLKEVLGKKFDKEASLSYWTGPSKKHDFTLPNTLIEIKTTSTDSKKINTSSTNQIAPVYDKKLKLIFIQLKKSIDGLSLSEVIDNYSKILKEVSELLFNDFILKLTQCGYLDMHKNEYDQKYKIDKFNFYNIEKNFPYIKEYVVPDGLSDLSITYKIDLEKCEDFRINEEELISNL